MHTQSHALHNGCDCSQCGGVAATFSYAWYRVLVRYMEMKNIPMQKSKLKNVQRWNTLDQPSLPPLLAQNVPTVCSLLKHVCGRGRRTGGREREKALTHVGARGLFEMGRASFTLQRRPLLKRQSGQTLLLQSILTDEQVPLFRGIFTACSAWFHSMSPFRSQFVRWVQMSIWLFDEVLFLVLKFFF